MANKREFKKFVTAVGASICEDMMINSYSQQNADRQKTSEAIKRVLVAVNQASSNANVFFDKGAKAFADRKEYSKAKHAYFKVLFKKINTDFATALNGAVKEFNEAMPKN